MTRSVRTALLVFVSLAVFAMLLRAYFSDNRHMNRYARQVERYLHQREETAAGFLSQNPPLSAGKLPQGLLQKEWGLAPFNIAWHQGDSLVFSLNNRYLPFDTLPAGSVPGYFLHSSGQVWYIGKRVSEGVTCWFPVWEQFDSGNPLLQDGFTGLPRIPESVVPTTERSAFGISGQTDGPLVFLRQAGPLHDPLERGLLFWLFAGMGLSASFLVNRAARFLARRYSPWWGVLFLVVFMAGMRLLLNPFLAPAGDAVSVLQEPVLYQTLGGLLLNTFFLLWLMVFFHREMEDLKFPSLPAPVAVFLAAVNYLSIILGMLLIAQTISNIVLYSSLNVYLENIFAVNEGGILAIAALALLFLAFFLFSHRMGRVILSMGLPLAYRMIALVLSLAAATPFYYWSGASFPLIGLLLAAIGYLSAMDFFSEIEKPNLTWMIGWLGIFSALTALLLSGFHLEKESKIQQNLAKRLSIEWEAPVVDRDEHKGVFAQLYAGRGSGPDTGLDRMEFAVYRDGLLAGKSQSGEFPLEESALTAKPEVGKLVRSASPGKVEWSYRNSSGTTVLVSRAVTGIMGPISMFSYLFALFILIMPVLALLNYWFNFLPNTLDFIRLKKPTLSTRIQFWVIGFLLVSFLIIGIFSIWNFRESADYNQEVQVKKKIDLIRYDAESWVAHNDTLASTKLLADKLIEMGRNNEIDLFAYTPDGKLAGSTFPENMEAKLAPARLGGIVQFWLHEAGKPLHLQAEKIGDFSFRTVYIPIRDTGGNPLAFAGLPFVNQPSAWQQELSGFISALINVYVFLLLLAGAFAIYIANSITEPISELGARLRELKLGKNEPLVYNRQDEVGELIDEYNRTLEKLEESTQKLAQSERESAWREMAKQVAHEIKNPLTPMRLGIQQMQYALLAQPEKVNQLVERVSKTILEQIDGLNEIATAFSNFAKMPQAENSTFPLNDVVSNVHELFRNEQPGFELALELPAETVYVFADKNQLMRVFNNLYKNAIQAIPEGRQGKISTRMYLQAGHVFVRVGDNGSGIPEATRDKVFVPNFTTKSSGSGLGLALSKNIVEMAGGRIYFETRTGNGTDFFVELPVVAHPQ